MTWHECRLTGTRFAPVIDSKQTVTLRIKFLAWMVDDSQTLKYLATTGAVWAASSMNHVEEGWV